jgi:hypothetical protein
MSCRGAAVRFGVAPSTAIELVSDWRSTGACEARVQGGDRRSARIENHAAEILGLVGATPDMTLIEIADHLFKAHGERFVPSVLILKFLCSCFVIADCSAAESFDRSEDVVGRFGPSERLGIGVTGLDIGVDRGF